MDDLIQITFLHFCDLHSQIVECGADGIEGRSGDFLVVLHAQPVMVFGIALVQSQWTFSQQMDLVPHIPEAGIQTAPVG